MNNCRSVFPNRVIAGLDRARYHAWVIPAGIGPEVVLKKLLRKKEGARSLPAGHHRRIAQLLAHNARTLDLQCGYQIVRRDEHLPDLGTNP